MAPGGATLPVFLAYHGWVPRQRCMGIFERTPRESRLGDAPAFGIMRFMRGGVEGHAERRYDLQEIISQASSRITARPGFESGPRFGIIRVYAENLIQ